MTPAQAVEAGFAVGMHQHRAEVLPFAAWLADRRLHHVIEIGALHGGTATLFHALCTGTVFSIDLPNGQFGGAAHHYDADRCSVRNRALVAQLPRLVPIAGDSHDPATADYLARQLAGDQVDLLFIDGDHTYAGVKADYERYAPFVRAGGLVAFHDILDTPLHRAAGCRVDQFWQELPGPKVLFSIDAEWGGIGVVYLL